MGKRKLKAVDNEWDYIYVSYESIKFVPATKWASLLRSLGFPKESDDVIAIMERQNDQKRFKISWKKKDNISKNDKTTKATD